MATAGRHASRFVRLALAAATVLLLAPATVRSEPAAASAEPARTLQAGDPAPDFDIATTPYGWRRFSDFWKDAPILVVFDPDERALVSLDRELGGLARSGIELTVVRRDGDGANWDALARLGLRYSLLSDPRGYVGELFGHAGCATAGNACWYLVGRDGRVRRMATGVATDRLAADIAAGVTGLSATAGGAEAR